nr:uncharacterized protein LOC118092209 [Zootoca vivipara]
MLFFGSKLFEYQITTVMGGNIPFCADALFDGLIPLSEMPILQGFKWGFGKISPVGGEWLCDCHPSLPISALHSQLLLGKRGTGGFWLCILTHGWFATPRTEDGQLGRGVSLIKYSLPPTHPRGLSVISLYHPELQRPPLEEQRPVRLWIQAPTFPPLEQSQQEAPKRNVRSVEELPGLQVPREPLRRRFCPGCYTSLEQRPPLEEQRPVRLWIQAPTFPPLEQSQQVCLGLGGWEKESLSWGEPSLRKRCLPSLARLSFAGEIGVLVGMEARKGIIPG